MQLGHSLSNWWVRIHWISSPTSYTRESSLPMFYRDIQTRLLLCRKHYMHFLLTIIRLYMFRGLLGFLCFVWLEQSLGLDRMSVWFGWSTAWDKSKICFGIVVGWLWTFWGCRRWLCHICCHLLLLSIGSLVLFWVQCLIYCPLNKNRYW